MFELPQIRVHFLEVVKITPRILQRTVEQISRCSRHPVHQDRIQQQTLDQISDTSFCAGSGGTRRALHSFLPGQSSTAFSEQNSSDSGPDIDLRAPRRKHAHCWRQTSPRGARQKEFVRDVTEKRSIRVSRIKKPAEITTILSRPS